MARLREIAERGEADVVKIPRRNIILGEWLKHGQWWPNDKRRFFHRDQIDVRAEMHGGFGAIRRERTMTVGQRVTPHAISPEVARDTARLTELWDEGLARFGGPWLAGNSFTAADAFYAPVAFRVRTYGIDVNAIAPGALDTRLLDEVLAAGPDAIGADFHARMLKVKAQGGTPLAVGAALGAFGLVLVIIGYLEWRTRRIDGVDQVVTELGIDIIGLDALVPTGRKPSSAFQTDDAGAPNDSMSWAMTFLNARAGTIYAGSSQIQKNIIGEMVLGLPKEPKPN